MNMEKLKDEQVQEEDTFIHPGRVVTSKGGCDEDIKNRLGKAKGQSRRLRTIWNSSIFSIKTKIKLSNSLVISVF